jgi:PTS system ascorbate-specific IIB component
MKIVCVCGMGIGTSILLKMNTEKAAAKLGIDADVTAADISSARGSAQGCDLILTSQELATELDGTSVPVVVINNFMDVGEIETKLQSTTGR